MIITITYNTLVYTAYAILSVTALWILLANLRTLWVNRKVVTYWVVALLCCGSGLFLVSTLAGSWNQKTDLTTKNNFDWVGTYLPGKWSNLHRDMNYCGFWEARLVAAEQFAAYDAKSEPALPAQGFNAICELVQVGDGANEQSRRQVARLSAALKQFVAALPQCDKKTEVPAKEDEATYGFK